MIDFCVFSVDDVEGIESLRWEDQQNIRKYVEAGGAADDTGGSSNKTATPKECGIEVSPTSRATCKQCNQKIMKGEVIFVTVPFFFLKVFSLLLVLFVF